MKKMFLYGAAALLAVCSYSLQALDLVKNGKASGNIVVAADALPPVKYAGSELAFYLKKITGAELKISPVASKDLNVAIVSRKSELYCSRGSVFEKLKRRELFEKIICNFHFLFQTFLCNVVYHLGHIITRELRHCQPL